MVITEPEVTTPVPVLEVLTTNCVYGCPSAKSMYNSLGPLLIVTVVASLKIGGELELGELEILKLEELILEPLELERLELGELVLCPSQGESSPTKCHPLVL